MGRRRTTPEYCGRHRSSVIVVHPIHVLRRSGKRSQGQRVAIADRPTVGVER